ncbi:MAG TPA: SDR family oxidoreductase [Acidimicrobiales bacterium]|jgi:NAD(P)-dependent dehydrogenase (short-subunit alcohol dehydrogenase family)|nr:SDR family oxidoreductase [Acidimicrobiales bacterium]
MAIPSFRLDGKTVLVTGVGPGIGAHVAAGYAEAGANLVLCARRPQGIGELAERLAGEGAKALAVVADVSRPEELDHLVKAAEDSFGSIDVVFNNAHANPAWSAQEGLEHGLARGELPDKGALDYRAEDWQAAFDVNVLAPYRLAQAVVPGMTERGGGVIINVLSAAAFQPALPVVAYGTTKAALHMLTRYLAKACAPAVRVNAICPASISPDGGVWEAFKAHIPKIPLGRIGIADELVGAALFLATAASSFCTGQVIFCDGGRVATVS